MCGQGHVCECEGGGGGENKKTWPTAVTDGGGGGVTPSMYSLYTVCTVGISPTICKEK